MNEERNTDIREDCKFFDANIKIEDYRNKMNIPCAVNVTNRLLDCYTFVNINSHWRE